jgi:hypothetical protein
MIRCGDVYAIAEIAVNGGVDVRIACHKCGDELRKKVL